MFKTLIMIKLEFYQFTFSSVLDVIYNYYYKIIIIFIVGKISYFLIKKNISLNSMCGFKRLKYSVRYLACY